MKKLCLLLVISLISIISFGQNLKLEPFAKFDSTINWYKENDYKIIEATSYTDYLNQMYKCSDKEVIHYTAKIEDRIPLIQTTTELITIGRGKIYSKNIRNLELKFRANTLVQISNDYLLCTHLFKKYEKLYGSGKPNEQLNTEKIIGVNGSVKVISITTPYGSNIIILSKNSVFIY